MFLINDNFKKHKKFCCVGRQCSKHFKSVNNSKDHNCNSNLKDAASEVVSTRNKALSSFEEDFTKNKATFSSSEASFSIKKSLKIKHHSHIEAAIYPAAEKSKHKILDDEIVEENDLDLKEFIEEILVKHSYHHQKNKVQNIFTFYYNKDFKKRI